MGPCKVCEAPHKMPPARNGLEALYSDVVQQLEQLQLHNLRKTMKKYLQSTEVKDWMRLKRRKSVQMIHPVPLKDSRIDDTKTQNELNQRRSPPTHSVNLECRAFPKYKNQRVENIGNRNMRNLLDSSRRQERVRELGPVAVEPSCIAAQSAPSNRKGDRLFNEPENLPTPPQRSSELGRFRKSVEAGKTYRRPSRASATVGCKALAPTRRSLSNPTKSKPRSPQVLPPTKTECSSTFFHIRNLKHDYDGTTHSINKLETRPASMTLRRELNCNSLIEEVKRQRALNAKLELRKRECLYVHPVNAPMAIVILRSNKQLSISNRNRNRNMDETRTGVLRNEYQNPTSCSETPTSGCFQGKRIGLAEDVECNGRRTRPSHHIESEQPTSRSMLVSALAQRSRPLATESRTTAILQDALEALECAHRWNEWGARTLHQLARASKIAVEKNSSWSRINEPQKLRILLPHDNDIVTSTRWGRVLESREEERAFIRDLLVVSGLTNGDWAEKRPLDAKHQHIVKRTYTRHKQHKEFRVSGDERRFTAEQENKKKLVDRDLLHDFVNELLRHELVLQGCALPGINLTTLMREHEHKGQALVQKVWNNLQTYPSSSDGICTAVQLVLRRDLKAQDPTWVEVAEVVQEFEKMIFENLVQELLEELQQVVALGDRVQGESQEQHTYVHVKI